MSPGLEQIVTVTNSQQSASLSVVIIVIVFQGVSTVSVCRVCFYLCVECVMMCVGVYDVCVWSVRCV